MVAILAVATPSYPLFTIFKRANRLFAIIASVVFGAALGSRSSP